MSAHPYHEVTLQNTADVAINPRRDTTLEDVGAGRGFVETNFLADAAEAILEETIRERYYGDPQSYLAHMTHPVIPVVVGSPFTDPKISAIFQALVEIYPSKIEGLRGGLLFDTTFDTTYNPTEEVTFTVQDRKGRLFERLIMQWMHRYVATKATAEILFIEPDQTGRTAVAVWHAKVHPISSGHPEHGRDIAVAAAQVDEPLTIRLRGKFTYGHDDHEGLAQFILDEMNNPASARMVEGDGWDWQVKYAIHKQQQT